MPPRWWAGWVGRRTHSWQPLETVTELALVAQRPVGNGWMVAVAGQQFRSELDDPRRVAQIVGVVGPTERRLVLHVNAQFIGQISNSGIGGSCEVRTALRFASFISVRSCRVSSAVTARPISGCESWWQVPRSLTGLPLIRIRAADLGLAETGRTAKLVPSRITAFSNAPKKTYSLGFRRSTSAVIALARNSDVLALPWRPP